MKNINLFFGFKIDDWTLVYFCGKCNKEIILNYFFYGNTVCSHCQEKCYRVRGDDNLY